MAGKMQIKRWCHVGRYCSAFAHIRAYAIRPYTCSIVFWDILVCALVSFPPTPGRMRYAPTPVRLIFCLYWFACWFRFRSHQGVCDMPLHLFDYYRGQIQLIIIPVRLISGFCWFACWFHFRPREGVCDTPLHLFDYYRGQIQLIIIPVRLFFGD